MKHPLAAPIISLAGIMAISLLAGIALSKGIDGALLSGAFASIFGIVGWAWGRTQKIKKEG